MSLEVKIRKAFDAFTLDIEFSTGKETLGFLGASGCGKSLTLRSIAGIETPDEGRIVVNGEVFFDSEQRINLTPQQRKTALLFQNYMLFPNMTIEQNVAAGIDVKLPREERKRIVEGELARFSLTGFENRYPAQLSGGQQQRVALARMLAASPGILMLDEPFSALDSHLKALLEQNLVDLFASYDGTILYVSHDIDEALRFCDRIAVVEKGHIVEIDTGEELIDDPKSVAALKLSGCKNVVDVVCAGDHRVDIPKWGISVVTERTVDPCVKALGVRAFNIRRVDGPGENCFKVRVDRFTDSRFDRTFLLGFVAPESEREAADAQVDVMKYMHERIFWRVNTLGVSKETLPKVGDELWINLPKEHLYLVA